MFEKIKLSKNELIVFMGSMNAMPMMYAWELKKNGYEVLYFVDAPLKDALSRPENHFPGISYPYPDWIVEINIPTQMIIPYFANFFAKYMLAKIRKINFKKINCFVLNGFFISLSSNLKRHGKIVALSHGSDLDVWANKNNAENLSITFHKRSIFKFIPAFLSKKLIIDAVNKQYSGFLSSNVVIYFPEGFNAAGDSVIKNLSNAGIKILRRYDISFEPLKGLSRKFKEPGDGLVIFSGVRFLYKTFPDGNKDYSKGNDIIIRGLAEYYKINKDIKIHFVEKGEDVVFAKQLCQELGLNDVIIWHKEMPFKKLLDIYIVSDICFDQVGSHWVGAIGAYALYLGKPLIANVNTAVRMKLFPCDNPILSVENPLDIFKALRCLENVEFRKSISKKSKIFVENNMSSIKLINDLFNRTI